MVTSQWFGVCGHRYLYIDWFNIQHLMVVREAAWDQGMWRSVLLDGSYRLKNKNGSALSCVV